MTCRAISIIYTICDYHCVTFYLRSLRCACFVQDGISVSSSASHFLGAKPSIAFRVDGDFMMKSLFLKCLS